MNPTDAGIWAGGDHAPGHPLDVEVPALMAIRR
jgi:hypothetical protein